MNNELKIFRTISFAEGISLLTLLFIAMPLKYFMGMPEIVKVVGWVHGILFIIYVGTLIMVQVTQRWPFIFLLAAFAASVIPFGTFVLDKQLRKKAHEAST
jgi:integral membrane protein